MKPHVLAVPTEMAQANLNERKLVGYASVFNYPIDTGTKQFPQKTYVRPGFFTRTLDKNRDMITVMVNHGLDPGIGMLPIGRPEVMTQDSTGLWTETALAKTRFNDDTLIPLLESGALRAMSIQFVTEQEEMSEDRAERDLLQGRLYEYGPVTIPANEAATATLQSLEMFARSAFPLEAFWDGPAAMRTCDSAGDFRQIAFELANDSDPDTAAHWALPHHPQPGAGPDPAGVAAALGRLNQTGQTVLSKDSIRNHLERHQGSEQSSSERVQTLEAARARIAAHAETDQGMEARWRALGS